jgi:imidazolonepropionase-like amidohydrolase
MIYMKEETIKNWVNSKKNIMNSPNYKADEIKNFIELRRKLIAECQRHGVGLLLGSDGPQVFNVPGFSVHHELQFMVDAGLTPYQALQSGTINVAKYFNLANSGMIKPGYRSDLVLLDANPLENIGNSRKIAGVMIGKNWISKEELTAELKKLEKPKQL